MKIFIIGLILLSGCATVSEYNQGCRDGVSGIGLEHAAQEKVNRYCNTLDTVRLLQNENIIPKNADVRK